MPTITFYPLGNADTCLLTLEKKLLLCDYAAKRNPDDPDDRRIDLPEALKDDINYPVRDTIDVVAFTHLDDDHICGASEFFHLDHADKYQGDGRIKITELWVPAAAIVEEGAEDESRIIRQEARHRLRQGYGIRIFSRPAHLKDWLNGQGLTLESRRHLITDAGQLVPGWSKDVDGVEFFVHSPFGERDGDTVLDRNEHSLVFQATFQAGGTQFLMAADTTCDIWHKIVNITRLHKNGERLKWDVYKLPHHCSYLSLSHEKGTVETKPIPNVQWLLDQGKSRAIVVSTSKPIDDVEDGQPPHFQAKNCYKTVLKPKQGKFMVTMEHRNRVSPERLVINVTPGGASLATEAAIGSGALISTPRSSRWLRPTPMRAAQLQRYLRNHRRIVHAKLVSASADKDADIVEMDVDVDLPQRPLHRISQTERIRVRFPSNDEMPQVFALRKSFPLLPHLVLKEEGYPRQLCLYQRPWSDERENWAPRAFVERIRRWLAGTADGTLHRNDQPLEPVMLNSPFRIALPEVPYVEGKLCRIERFFINRVSKFYWVGQRKKPAEPSTAFAMPVIFVQGPAVTHGIIHQIPVTLGELEKVLVNLGGSLIESISKEMAAIRADLQGLGKELLMIVVELPKIRVEGGPVESVEHQAFIVAGEIGDLLKVEEVQVQKGRLWIPEKRELFRDPKRLQATKLMPLSVRWHLSPRSAAEMNGYAPRPIKVVAIGAGSLGSQTINNLWRGGFGEWTLVDDDVVEPHNPARHLVNSHAVGFKKGHALSIEMDSLYPGREAPTWIDCNFLSSGAEEAKLELALRNAELIVDLSASIAVERRLAKDRRSSARRISAFLNQRGDESVLLIEDSDRKVELVWLEAEYMRAVAFDSQMAGHFDTVETVAHRYGNGCRDVSATVAQDGVAIHAGLLSHGIRKAADRKEAAVRVNRWSRETGGVSAVNVEVSVPLTADMAGWEVMVHREVVQQLDELRKKNLPNETGGILLGLVDRNQRFVTIVGMLPAPPDSEIWPTSFIRGSNGLARSVDKITKRTLGNVIYLGEWHSHPAGCDATPSVPDLAAIAICSPNTRADGLPTLMLIVAERELCLVLEPTDRDEIHVMKFAA